MTSNNNPLLVLYSFWNHKINGRIKSQIGVNFPKGFSLVINYLSLSKDGIANILDDWNFLNALAARGIGFIDTILTTIALPFMIVAYVALFIFAVLSWIFLWIPALVAWKKKTAEAVKFKTFMTMMALIIPTSPLSLLTAIVLMALSILQIIVPEFTCYVLQIHKWGRNES